MEQNRKVTLRLTIQAQYHQAQEKDKNGDCHFKMSQVNSLSFLSFFFFGIKCSKWQLGFQFLDYVKFGLCKLTKTIDTKKPNDGYQHNAQY